MAILARVLMLAACLPLLQPSGLCACKAGGWRRTSPLGQDHAEADDGPGKTGCCPHRHGAGGPDHTAAPRPDESSHYPDPGGDSHLPGCPASPGVDRFKWVEPAHAAVHLATPVEAVATLLPVAVEYPAPPAPTLTAWSGDPPLYLSHCSFVI